MLRVSVAPTSYSPSTLRARSLRSFASWILTAASRKREQKLNDVDATFSPDKAHRGTLIFRRHVTCEHVHSRLQCLASYAQPLACTMNYVEHGGGGGGEPIESKCVKCACSAHKYHHIFIVSHDGPFGYVECANDSLHLIMHLNVLLNAFTSDGTTELCHVCDTFVCDILHSQVNAVATPENGMCRINMDFLDLNKMQNTH